MAMIHTPPAQRLGCFLAWSGDAYCELMRTNNRSGAKPPRGRWVM